MVRLSISSCNCNLYLQFLNPFWWYKSKTFTKFHVIHSCPIFFSIVYDMHPFTWWIQAFISINEIKWSCFRSTQFIRNFFLRMNCSNFCFWNHFFYWKCCFIIKFFCTHFCRRRKIQTSDIICCNIMFFQEFFFETIFKVGTNC